MNLGDVVAIPTLLKLLRWVQLLDLDAILCVDDGIEGGP
jgi:hypothetical protein